MKDETLDLYNLLDYLILKPSFRIHLNRGDDNFLVLTQKIDETLKELKSFGLFTPISSGSRFVIHKDREQEVENFLAKKRTFFRQELGNITDEALSKMVTFTYSWVWFTFEKLKGADIQKRYESLIANGMANILSALLEAMKDRNLETYKLRNKDQHIELLTTFMSKLKELSPAPDNFNTLAKLLVECKVNITNAEGVFTQKLNEIEKEIRKDIIKSKKAPRKIELV